MTPTNYSQLLRALGQALELLNVSEFDVEPDGDDLLVRGKAIVPVTNSIELPPEKNIVRDVWDLLPGQRTLELGLNIPAKPLSVTGLDLRYTPSDINRLEREGQSRRMNFQQTVDPATLSQLLRTVGAYINQQPARLVKISQKGALVLVQYQTLLGSRGREAFTLAELYDFWVKMCTRRADRKAGWPRSWLEAM
jgi:hypothetical protein